MKTTGIGQDKNYDDDEKNVTSWNRNVTRETQRWARTNAGDWLATMRTGITLCPQNHTHSSVFETANVSITWGARLQRTYTSRCILTNNGMTNHVYAWNPENRHATTTVNAATSTYAYDVHSRRSVKTVNEAVVKSMAVVVHGGGATAATCWQGKQRCAIAELTGRVGGGGYVDEVLALINSTGKYYYHANHLYSVAALTNAAGAVVERYRYDTFGNRTVLAPDGFTTRAASSYGQQVGFTGRYLDKETGLWYFRARYYSGSLGRFIGRDSFHGKSMKNALQASDKQSNERTEKPVSNYIVPEFSLNEFMTPMAGDGYQDGMNLMMAYFAPNKLDPSGLLKCCSDYRYYTPGGQSFASLYECGKATIREDGWITLVGGAIGGVVGTIGGGLGGGAAGTAVAPGPGTIAGTWGGAEVGGLVGGAIGAGVGTIGGAITYGMLLCTGKCNKEVAPTTCDSWTMGMSGYGYCPVKTSVPCCPKGSESY